MKNFNEANILGIIQNFKLSNGDRNKQRISVARLADISHVDERIVKDVIQNLRRNGARISGSSSSGGYYWAETVEQFDEAIRTKRAGLRTGEETLRAMEKTRLEMVHDGQMGKLF